MTKEEDHITIILDDDPTGTQTVYDVTVLTDFSVESLDGQFRSGERAFFILTNTRAFPPGPAKLLVEEICKNIRKAASTVNVKISIILRGDSTLRGHFPLEEETVENILGTSHKWVICPFFLEGNRVTKKDIHYLVENGRYIPMSETIFAKDPSFGYVSSDLKEWAIEKSGGRFSPDDITSLDGELISKMGEPYVLQRLATGKKIFIVNAETMTEVNIVANACKAMERKNETFLYRTAASFVQAYLQKEKREPLRAATLITTGPGENHGGLIVVGSYVPKTTKQLQQLFLLPGLVKIEINVPDILGNKLAIAPIIETINDAISSGVSVVLFTSRNLFSADNIINNLSIGKQVSDTLIAIVQQLRHVPSYCIAKGGITSSDMATKGLGVGKATILGQALPGVPVWLTGVESRFPGLRFIIFPGNVGDADALQKLVAQLEEARNSQLDR